MLSYLDALVEPQREALSVALGLASGEPPESFLVALAALNLLAQAAEDRPLLCIVDDVQWLDQATAQVLGFVGRRLLAEPVGLVFAARPTAASEDPLAGLPDLRLSGLDERSARALLASVTTGRLDESVRRRILEEAHGNPLALRELGVVDFAGGFAMPDRLSVPRRIEDQYLTRLRGLPRATQRLLLVAAADPVGDPALLARAAHALDLDVGALEVAVDAGLLDIGAGVRFRHPLLWCGGARAGTAGRRRCRRRALPRRHRIVFLHPHGFSPRAGTTALRRMAAAQHRRTDAATQLRRAQQSRSFRERGFFPEYYHMNYGYWGSITVWQPSLWNQLTWSAFSIWDPLYWGRFDIQTEVSLSPYFQFTAVDDRAAFYDHWYYSYLLANPTVEWNPVDRYNWIITQIHHTQRKLHSWLSQIDGWRYIHYTHKLEQLQVLKAQMEMEYPFLIGTATVSLNSADVEEDVVVPEEHEQTEHEGKAHRRQHKGGSRVHVEVIVD